MKKVERTVDLTITIDPERIRAAAVNASRVSDVALEISTGDPRDLSIDEQIFGLELLPVNDKAKAGPNTAMYVAVKPIIVETLSGRAKPGFITVNGTIDIPKEPGRLQKIEDCFFSNQIDARAVCRVITEVELERSLDRQLTEKENSDFLTEQLKNDRF